MTATTMPYHSELPVGRDGFAQLLHAEWTKFRTVRGWVIGAFVAVLVVVLLALLTGSGSHTETCIKGKCSPGGPSVPIGPGGEPVIDSFYFVHQPLSDNASITVRVGSLTGATLPDGGGAGGSSAGSPNSQQLPAATSSGVQPWAKAGLIITQDTAPGAAYAAIMVTGSHGVRMQNNYTNDTAGSPGAVSAASPRWLRLTRTGSILTGYESTDGTHWTKVGTVQLAGLSPTVQAGLFVASPPYQQVSQQLGGSTGTQSFTLATAAFDNVSLHGPWSGTQIDPGNRPPPVLGKFQQSGGAFSVSGSGDIAPTVGFGRPIERTLAGAFGGLIVLIVLATLFITGEYRRGLIRTTLAASPRRGRVLAAKAVVIGAVAFLTGLVAATIAIPVGERILRSNGNYIYPVSTLTQLRVIAGTAALFALAAVLALALGAVLRRSAGAVAAVIVLIVLPYILSVASVLPTGVTQWLLRLTPAAAFAIQQSVPQYPQVSYQYTPANGYFPLAPWAGLAVLCAYTALAMGLAVILLRRRDA
jgi:ABC-type transport system involved in multi-copper enzyme maturation permease subunit